MADIKISKYGSIFPRTIISIEHIKEEMKNIACKMDNNCILEGTLRGLFETGSGHKILGIEIDSFFPFCMDKDNELLDPKHCAKGYMIFIESNKKFIELNDCGIVVDKITGKSEDLRFRPGDIVLVQIADNFKAATIKKSGKISDIPCHEIMLAGEDELITVLDKNVFGKLLDDKGLISELNEHIKLEKDDNIVNVKLGQKFKYGKYEGKLRWKGNVNGLGCVGIETDSNELSDFSHLINEKESYWIMIPFDKCDYVSSNSRSNDEPTNKTDTKFTKTQEPKVEQTNYNRTTKPEQICKDESKVKLRPPLSTMAHLKTDLFKAPRDASARTVYAIVNSMFLYTEMFDNLLYRKEKNSNYNDMALEIVMSLRSNEKIEIDSWEKLAKNIASSPNRDESFNGILQYMGFKHTMYNLDDKKTEEIPFLNLSSFKMKFTKPKLMDLINVFCLEENFLILKPPKSLILGFLGQRNNLAVDKSGERSIQILSKLDISKLIVTCSNCCSVCSSLAEHLCLDCSKDKMDITYFCKDHKTHCKHEKTSIDEWKNMGTIVKPKIELDLSSVICKKNSEYDVYAKTNDVKGNWMHLKINERGECQFNLIDLQSYFQSTSKIDKADMENLERHMVMCVYKYPPLEFYFD